MALGRSRIRAAAGPHEAQDGKAVIWNGVVKGKCFGYYDRHGGYNGPIAMFWLRGEARETGDGGGSGWGGEGSAFYTVSDGSLE